MSKPPQPRSEASLDQPAKMEKGTAPGPNACNPATCELGDHGKKWAGEVNFDCTRCAFATVDRDVAISRNPKLAA